MLPTRTGCPVLASRAVSISWRIQSVGKSSGRATTIAPVIRFLLGWAVISYGLFGFIFGNRPIRFFLAWTLIIVLPYCVVEFPADWLNIRYLYQVSIGFVFVLASGTVYSTDLLHRTRWQRGLPLIAPLVFILMSAYITMRLDTKYEIDAASEQNRTRLEQLRESG